jgi:hypothetical protein
MLRGVGMTGVQVKGPSEQAMNHGGREGIRTLDLSVANAALSQLSYAPTATTFTNIARVPTSQQLRLFHSEAEAQSPHALDWHNRARSFARTSPACR